MMSFSFNTWQEHLVKIKKILCGLEQHKAHFTLDDDRKNIFFGTCHGEN